MSETETPPDLVVDDQPMSVKSLITFTLFVIPAFALLIWLGIWQIHRLHWKEGLLHDIDTRVHAAPVPLEKALAMAGAGQDVKYLRVRLHGSFDNSKERYLYGVSDAGTGWLVVTPFKDDDGTTVLVERGFVPDRLKDPAKRPEGQLNGEIAVVGLVRNSQAKGYFTPVNDPAKDQWFTLDVKQMAASMFPAGTPKIAPFFVDAEKTDIPGGYPRGGQTNLELPNNHLQYSITWFALAAGLLYVYFRQAWHVLRTRRKPPASDA